MDNIIATSSITVLEAAIQVK